MSHESASGSDNYFALESLKLKLVKGIIYSIQNTTDSKYLGYSQRSPKISEPTLTMVLPSSIASL